MNLFIQGSLSFANILLAVFVLFFAISFLKKTRHTSGQNPWLFLLFAVIVFFFIQVLKVFELIGQITLDSYMFYLDSMFIVIVLFTFIFQYNLILNSEVIQIKRKSYSDPTLADLESELKSVQKIEKKLEREEKTIVSDEQKLEKYTLLAKKYADKLKKKSSKK